MTTWLLQHTHLFCCLLLYFSIPSADALRIGANSSQPRPRHSLSFPVYHKSFVQLIDDADVADVDPKRRQLARRVLGPSNVPELRSEVVTLAEPFGVYFAELQVGTPAEDVALILDTGSELMWLQCGPQADAASSPSFDPEKSSSYQSLTCDAEMCVQTDGGEQTFCMTDSQTCGYQVGYGDKSYSSGILAQETLTFTEADGSSTFPLTQFVLGCGTNNAEEFKQLKASGLMGLDRGVYSIISQLGVDVFSYCLPNRENNVDVSGYLTLGAGGDAGASLQYTPLIQTQYSRFFYYLTLTGVSVNGMLLNIPAVAFQIDAATGSGGTFIDSGTTLTAFVDEAYTVITQAFDDYMGASNYQKVQLGSDQLCYSVPLSDQQAGGAPAAPNVALHFAGSVDMELGTDQLFHLYGSDTTNNYYCLAMANAGATSGARNVIGNFQQQDFLVEYDIANSRLGLAPTQCNNAPPN